MIRLLLCLLLATTAAAEEHPFWDKTNLALHGANLAIQLTDMSLTRYDLDCRGRHEDNPFARPWTNRGWPGTVTMFVAVNGGASLAGSYAAHRLGHHRVERLIPLWSIGNGAFAIGYTIHNW